MHAQASGLGTALRVDGRAAFSRSGEVVTGKVTIHLSKAPGAKAGATVKVAWFVVN